VEYIQSHALSMTGTFTDLASSMGVCEWFIRDVFAAHVEQLAAAYTIQPPRYMGIDEIYVENDIYCVITDIERRCMIDLLPKRDMETVKRWLAQLPCPEMVEAVTMDLWNPYRLSIVDKLPCQIRKQVARAES
jgi:transposase